MEKIDLKKDLKPLYQPSAREIVQVEVPKFKFLMIDGEGDPNTAPAYAQAIEAKRQKKLPAIDKLRLEDFLEGRCAQVLHVGPFSEEGPTIERLHEFIDSRTGRTGKQHEIYLSDIRRADPKKWKTIVRQPMK